MKKRLKKYFIPHKENDYKPHLLRPKAIALACIVIVVAESAFLFSSTYLVPHSKLFGIIVSNALVDETNQSRTTNGLPALQENALLDAAAQDKANDMVKNNYFAHTSPSGITPWYWFQQVGYNYEYAGENLAVNFSDSQDVTNAWMNSPEHRANILDVNYTDIGMATAQGTYEGHPATYVVELFGTLAPTPTAFSVIPGVSTAQAAPTPVTVATTPAPVKQPVPAAAKPKPVSAPAPATTSVASQPTTTIAAPFVATQTASSDIMTSTVQSSTQNATTVVLGFTTSDSDMPTIRESNAFQQALSDPKTLANDFYLFLMILFGFALALNVFIKIRVQHPKLIFGALLVIVVAGLAVMLNQSAAAHIAIL